MADARFVVLVGLKCYGSYSELEKAKERFAYWSGRYHGVMCCIERRETVMDNGVGTDLSRVLRDGC